MPETWPGHPSQWSASLDYGSAQTDAEVKAAPGAGRALVITSLTISNGATAGKVTLLAGAGGALLYTLYPAINGGACPPNINIKLPENTAVVVTSTTVTTHAVNLGGHSEPA